LPAARCERAISQDSLNILQLAIIVKPAGVFSWKPPVVDGGTPVGIYWRDAYIPKANFCQSPSGIARGGWPDTIRASRPVGPSPFGRHPVRTRVA
jgi:hypothetical protein